MRDGGHDPSVLCLEVAEGALEPAPELAMRQLAALNELGITLAIDDFGTGTLLLDHAVGAAGAHPQDRHDARLAAGRGRTSDAALVGAVVELGHALGLSVVAEGVETDAQLAQLRQLGCDGAQGYLFSQPMPEDGVHSLLGTGVAARGRRGARDAQPRQARSTNPAPRRVRISGGSPSLRRRRVT